MLALALFAVIAALAGGVILLQAMRRSLARWEPQQRVLSALGATGAERTLAGSIALAPFVLIGVPLAIVGTYVASTFFPLGSVRSLEPAPGMRADSLALVAGGAWLLIAFVAATVFVASRASSPPRARSPLRRRSKLAERAGQISAPPAATVGALFTLAPGMGRRALPVRTALVGALLAVIGVAGCIVFTASMQRLVTTPARFGLEWDLKMELANLSKQATLAELTLDPRLSDVAVLDTADVTVEANSVHASSLESRKGTIEPVMIQGRPPTGPSEIALGPKLLASLGKRVGDRVRVETAKGTIELTVVGTMLSPESESDSFNAEALLTPGALQLYGSDYFGQTVMRFAPHTRASTVTAALDRRYPYGVMDESAPNAPPEIRNLAQVTHIPLALGAFLALLGLAALAHALIVTTGTRRRDLAVLRALGFTRPQAAATIAAMATTIAGIGLLGVPLGIVAGNLGWRAVTRELHVASDSAIPLGFVLVFSAVVLVLANVIAAFPAWSAARERPAAGLHAE